jgi:hypothetical protein
VVALYEFAKLLGEPAEIKFEPGKLDVAVPLPPTIDFDLGHAFFLARVTTDLRAVVVTRDKLIPARLIAAVSGDMCDDQSGFDFVLEEKPTSAALGAFILPPKFPRDKAVLTNDDRPTKENGGLRVSRAGVRVDLDGDGTNELGFKAIGIEYAAEESAETWIAGPWYRATVEAIGEPTWAIELVSSKHCEVP